MNASVTRRTVRLHGHDLSFAEAGSEGPVVVLLHGIAGSSRTWDPVLPLLADSLHLIAPDLLGHGMSAKPRADYSLGAFASEVRDLLDVLGHQRVTIVGHSLGGGVAMQFAYQFPARTERLVLVSSGGLGPEVTPLLRAATLPGTELVLPLLTNPRVRDMVGAIAKAAARLPMVRPRPSAAEVARGFESLADVEAQRAFIATIRSVLDLQGQRVDATEWLYVTTGMPVLFIWGECDPFIPVAHGRKAAAAVAGSRLVIFESAGHFPHVEEPHRFAEVLRDFVMNTEPSRLGENGRPVATEDRLQAVPSTPTT